MTWVRILWVAGAYLAGSLPSTYLLSRAGRATDVLRLASREASEADAHVLMARHLGGAWAGAAGVLDVAKGFAYVLVARSLGELPSRWLALAGVAVVVGHCWPPYARGMAGRGLAAASGVFLALVPVPMVVAGVIILAGVAVRRTGLASTVGLVTIPVAAAVQGQPTGYTAMGAAILAAILLRRLEGVGELIRRGLPPSRAVLYRAIFDASGLPQGEEAAGEEPSGSG